MGCVETYSETSFISKSVMNCHAAEQVSRNLFNSSCKNETMIQAVTFDLWGTLILDLDGYDCKVRVKREELLYNAVKGKISKDELVNALEQSWLHIQSIRETLRDVPTSEQIQILQALLNVDADLEKPYTEAVLHLPPRINPCAKEVLTHLNTRIGLISNTGRTPGTVLRSVLSTLGILEFFDVTLFSNEVGYLKPHPAIFKEASRTLGVPLSQMLHVGDDTDTDIQGALQTGMQALLVETPSDLLKVLEVVQ